MENTKSRVTIHMAASLDGFIARRDGSVEWLETSDHFEGGETMTSRELRKTRDTVEFYSGDLARLVDERLKPNFRSIWFVGGGEVSGECLRRGLADEVRYSIMPVLIGDGISFFERLDTDVALHLAEVKGFETGMVALRYEVRKLAKAEA